MNCIFLSDFLRFAFSRFVSYVLLVHFLHLWAKLEFIISKAYGCAGASNCEVNAVGANSLFTEEACRMPAESVYELYSQFFQILVIYVALYYVFEASCKLMCDQVRINFRSGVAVAFLVSSFLPSLQKLWHKQENALH